ncbi:oxygenase MpaB family protein [Nocardioides sp.]|uniref:oxygenase MpaB family protein n=1 Tax=Nocardioides sp. TaxID=35761 RepID=UPI0035132340
MALTSRIPAPRIPGIRIPGTRIPTVLQSRRRLAERYEPHADQGFFGPGSVTWKVWSHPTSVVLGFTRSVTIEHLDPNLAAAVVTSGGVKYRPRTRYGRTVRYFAMVAFGATEPTAKAADVLVKVHTKAIGHDPVTGGTYDANRPSSQLWIHMTAWHSILYCYEKFGPGPLSAAEEAQYWAECARAAELQTIDPDTVPRSREEVRAYFAQWRPHLATSEAAQDMVRFILGLDVALPQDLPRWLALGSRPLLTVMRAGIVATYPRHVRAMFDVRQSRAVDAAAILANRVGHRVLAASVPLQIAFLELLAPDAVAVAAPVLLDLPAREPITMTPREAQARYGFDRPDRAHPDLRARQHERVFGQGVAPSDEGLVESEAHIGPMATSRG